MHDFRNSTALRQLADLGHEPDSPDWDWAIARLERPGGSDSPSRPASRSGHAPATAPTCTGSVTGRRWYSGRRAADGA